jgi:hypothetical protein
MRTIKTLFVTVILGCTMTLTACGQPASSSGVKKQNDQKKCSAIIEGLILCTTSPVISVKVGENVPIDLSLQNVGGSEIKIVTAGGFEKLYKVCITGPDAKKLFSRREQREAMQEKGKITAEDLLAMPVNGGSFGEILKPQQELKIQYNLDYFYDFSAKGKYSVQITRLIYRPDGSPVIELPLDSIGLEID